LNGSALCGPVVRIPPGIWTEGPHRETIPYQIYPTGSLLHQTRQRHGETLTADIDDYCRGLDNYSVGDRLPAERPEQDTERQRAYRYPSACRLNNRAYAPSSCINSAWLPSSTILPADNTTIRSALRTVEKRWEISTAMRVLAENAHPFYVLDGQNPGRSNAPLHHTCLCSPSTTRPVKTTPLRGCVRLLFMGRCKLLR